MAILIVSDYSIGASSISGVDNSRRNEIDTKPNTSPTNRKHQQYTHQSQWNAQTYYCILYSVQFDVVSSCWSVPVCQRNILSWFGNLTDSTCNQSLIRPMV